MNHEFDRIFTGEVGVHEVILPQITNGWVDDDHDRNNLSGMAWGRRNYAETSYLSGRGDAYPESGSSLYAGYYS